MTRPIPQQAVACVKQFESCVLKAYPDPATGGAPWTIGWGHTGSDVHSGLTITQGRADASLNSDLTTAANRLYAKIGSVADELSDSQYSALLSFVFNLGTGDPSKPEWRIWKLLRARKLDQVPPELQRFVNGGGKVMQGLVNRRNAEIALWLSGADETPVPSSVTRSMPTPPTPAVATVTPDTTFWGKCAGAVGGCALAAKQVSDTISPYASVSPHVGQMVAILGGTLAALGVVALIVEHFKKKHA